MRGLKYVSGLTHSEALEVALNAAKHLDHKDAPHIREAQDLAIMLDLLIAGRNPKTRRNELVSIGRRYNEVLEVLQIGRYMPVAKPETLTETAKEKTVEPAREPTALERMMLAVVND